MSPTMLVDPDHRDAIEAGRMPDQQLAAQLGDRAVGGVPGDAEDPGDAGDRDMIEHHRSQRPHPRRPRQPRPPTSHRPQPMPPHLAAAPTFVAWSRDLQPRRPVPQRQMREPSQHRVMTPTLPTTARTPVVADGDLAEQDRVVGEDLLTGHGQTQRVQPGEPVQIRNGHQGRGRSS